MRGSKGSQGVCVVEGCGETWRTKQMCQKHYDASRRSERAAALRARRTQDPERFREYSRQHYKRHIYKRRTEAARAMIERNHGIPYEEWQQRVDRPCAICGTEEARMVLDHDHVTGATRDALCSNCNTGIGLLADDPDRIIAAARYIQAHRLEYEFWTDESYTETLADDAREVKARS